MPLTLVRAGVGEKVVVDRLLQLYLHELSRYEDMTIGEDGRFDYPHLDSYWLEPGRYPYLIRIKGLLGGFCLMRDEEDGTHTVAEFFVLESYRRMGLGEEIARQLFEQHPGCWAVGVLEENDVATLFWRNVIRRYTHRNFEEAAVPGWVGPVFRFRSPVEEPRTDEEPRAPKLLRQASIS